MGRQEVPAIPRARKNRMKKRVPSTSPESQAHLEESTAEMPSSMKMTVSAQLARVFIVYLTVVRDLWEMLASTYFLQPRPHMVTLGKARIGQMRRWPRQGSASGVSASYRVGAADTGSDAGKGMKPASYQCS